MAARPVFLAALLLPAVAGGQVTLAPAPVTQPGLESRLARVERLVDSGALVEMATRLEQVQAELQQLRGLVEVQGRDVEVLKQRQRDLYLDIDRRLRKLEVGDATAAPQPSAAPPSAPPPAVPPAVASTPPPVPAPSASSPPAAAPPPTVPPAAAVDPAAVQQAYQAAFDQLKEGRYAESIAAFQQFLVDYPNGPYADNALYWLGEANYVTRKFDVAAQEFRKVLDRHPGSSKVPDAMLKLGYSHYELEQWVEARKVLTELRTLHPSSTASRLAASRLQRMAQEGR